MKHLICVGACYIDTILSVPHYPDEDAKQRATSLQVRRGGNCGNTLEVLQQLLAAQPPLSPQSSQQAEEDVQLYLVATLPARNSRAAETIASSFAASPAARPVSLVHCLYREEYQDPASSYIIRSEATGSRTIVNHNPLPEMTTREFQAIVDHFSTNDDTSETWWHFEGRIPESIIRCIEYLRRELPSSKVSVEIEKPGREGLRELAALADVIFYSKTWAEAKGYSDAESCLKAEATQQASLALCTWGAKGAAALSRTPVRAPTHARANVMQRRDRLIACPVEKPVAKVLDTVGAGDTFIAGVLYGVACHREIDAGDRGTWEQSALSFAVELASCKVQIEGFLGLVSMVRGSA